MTRPIIAIHNTGTDEFIEREMNDSEFAEYEANKALAEAVALEQAAAVNAKIAAQAKLAALGLTTDDLKALSL